MIVQLSNVAFHFLKKILSFHKYLKVLLNCLYINLKDTLTANRIYFALSIILWVRINILDMLNNSFPLTW